MNRANTPQYIATDWTDDVERSLEFGDSPVLELGTGNALLDSVSALLAVQEYRLLQLSNTTLQMPSGGLGHAWVAALLQPTLVAECQSNTEIVYSGENQAEYLTSVSLMQSRLDPIDSPIGSRTIIPASHYYPRTQPGMALTWDSLPFECISSEPIGTSQTSTEYAGGEGDYSDGMSDWLAWMALLMALCLIIIAIIL